MEIKDLKKISISNLILIILNDKNIDVLRKCAEAELRERVKYVGNLMIYYTSMTRSYKKED